VGHRSDLARPRGAPGAEDGCNRTVLPCAPRRARLARANQLIVDMSHLHMGTVLHTHGAPGAPRTLCHTVRPNQATRRGVGACCAPGTGCLSLGLLRRRRPISIFEPPLHDRSHSLKRAPRISRQGCGEGLAAKSAKSANCRCRTDWRVLNHFG
jgi:hypothetical protein